MHRGHFDPPRHPLAEGMGPQCSNCGTPLVFHRDSYAGQACDLDLAWRALLRDLGLYRLVDALARRMAARRRATAAARVARRVLNCADDHRVQGGWYVVCIRPLVHEGQHTDGTVSWW